MLIDVSVLVGVAGFLLLSAAVVFYASRTLVRWVRRVLHKDRVTNDARRRITDGEFSAELLHLVRAQNDAEVDAELLRIARAAGVCREEQRAER